LAAGLVAFMLTRTHGAGKTDIAETAEYEV
jgi:hypothetical protein